MFNIICQSLENCKLKNDITILIRANADNNQKPYLLLVGLQNGIATLGDSLAVSCKTTIHRLIIWSSSCAPYFYPNELKMYIHTRTCPQMYVKALFIIVKIWKQLKCLSIGEWINKLVHLCNGILFSDKKKVIWRKQFHIAKWWGPYEKVICCMIQTVWHSRKGKTVDIVKRSAAQGGERERWIGGAQIFFRAVILKWWIHAIIHLSKIHRM